MASASDTDAVSATLSTTTVDTATITGRYKSVEVHNRAASGGTDIWVKMGAGATPTVAGAGCRCVPAASALTFDVLTDGEDLDVDKVVNILGNGNAYTISGAGR